MKESTAVWHILHGKPVLDKALRQAAVNVLRGRNKDYSKLIKLAQGDYEEAITPKLEKYAEKYRRSPNQSGSINPTHIILHHSSGSFAGTVSWIMQKISKVSYHYVINPLDGSRVQHVFDSKKAWHAGRSFYKGLTSFNSRSIGISFAGDTYKRDVADFEIDSAAKKCIYLMDKFDIPIQNILTHEMIAKGRKNDPSPSTHARVIERTKELLK